MLAKPAIEGALGVSENEYAAAVAKFLRDKGVTRCPTACIVPTHGNVTEVDRTALRDYGAAREAARQEKFNRYQQMVAVN
jgi:hypothetical protein